MLSYDDLSYYDIGLLVCLIANLGFGIIGGAVLSSADRAGTGFLLGFLGGPFGASIAMGVSLVLASQRHTREVLIEALEDLSYLQRVTRGKEKDLEHEQIPPSREEEDNTPPTQKDGRVHLTCENCKSRLAVKSHLVGTTIPCKKCGHDIFVMG